MARILGRLGLHLGAALGALTIFVVAVALGAQQPQAAPQVTAATPGPTPSASPARVIQERSLSGNVVEVLPDAIVVEGPRGRKWRVAPAPGALIRLNNRQARLAAIQVGDRVVVLGQARGGDRFMAHAITARRRP